MKIYTILYNDGKEGAFISANFSTLEKAISYLDDTPHIEDKRYYQIWETEVDSEDGANIVYHMDEKNKITYFGMEELIKEVEDYLKNE